METRSFRRSSVATTLARAVQDAAFKKCCLHSGRYDGANRNHFFPRIVGIPIPAGRTTWVISSVKRTIPTLPTCPQFNRSNPVPGVGGTAVNQGGPNGY